MFILLKLIITRLKLVIINFRSLILIMNGELSMKDYRIRRIKEIINKFIH